MKIYSFWLSVVLAAVTFLGSNRVASHSVPRLKLSIVFKITLERFTRIWTYIDNHALFCQWWKTYRSCYSRTLPPRAIWIWIFFKPKQIRQVHNNFLRIMRKLEVRNDRERTVMQVSFRCVISAAKVACCFKMFHSLLKFSLLCDFLSEELIKCVYQRATFTRGLISEDLEFAEHIL